MRDGLNPTRLRLPPLPDLDPPRTIAEYLLARFPQDTVRLQEKLAAGEVLCEDGSEVTITTAYRPHIIIFLYRDPAPETPVPFDITVIHHDEHLLVIDKPHFLATTPRGAYITETVLVRLRKEYQLPELSPAHRLDRLTAGVLILTTHRGARRAYQELFASRSITKTYAAIAEVNPLLTFPHTIQSHIINDKSTLWSREMPDLPPNSHTKIDMLATHTTPEKTLGYYRLTPHTGKTHQLRVHMASLGIPILGDNFYPNYYPVAPDDYRNPLQLLAARITFTDPYTQTPQQFDSTRTLSRWPLTPTTLLEHLDQ